LRPPVQRGAGILHVPIDWPSSSRGWPETAFGKRSATPFAEALQGTATVIISSCDDDETKRVSLAAGTNGFIWKIAFAKDLVTGVWTILAHAKKAA